MSLRWKHRKREMERREKKAAEEERQWKEFCQNAMEKIKEWDELVKNGKTYDFRSDVSN